MMLTKEERSALIDLKVQKAKDTFKEAEGISTLKFWNAVANRLYYSCYYITSALLLKHSYSAQSHKGVIGLLGLHFIKKGIVSRDSGKLFSRLFEMRQTGDYDDLFNLTEEEVLPLIPAAEEYLDEILKLIEKNG